MNNRMPDLEFQQAMSASRRMCCLETRQIVALSAKAMNGDREKCLEAGASDYIAKPVDPEQLLDLMRSWLHK